MDELRGAVRLTQHAHGAGCASKLKISELTQLLRLLPAQRDARVLVGTGTRDDAAVFRLDAERALVATTDFFAPVVDDARDFGRIAAANALSDIWAMGATPLFALNLVGFPTGTLPLHLLGEILAGGAEKAAEAGIPILGGHSIDDPEPKYGLAVVGLVHPDHILRNSTGRPGDALILTKPLGSGVLTTAMKRGLLSRADAAEVTEVMATLNRGAAEVLLAHREHLHALTDVTGFGLLGHLSEMTEGAGLGAELWWGAVPLLSAAAEHATADRFPAGSRANLDAVAPHLDCAPGLRGWQRLLLADAQTSGGLLAAVAPQAAAEVVTALRAANLPHAAVIGALRPQPGIRVR
ncbi:MAG: selenide, water dikinase SelD [Deltaproteobacteria bacterium]|nr:selenide, water dikinase SelD [Deltaproteobacteria bacterium]